MQQCLLPVREPQIGKTDLVGPQLNPVPMEEGVGQAQPLSISKPSDSALEDLVMLWLGHFEEGEHQFASGPERSKRVLKVQITILRGDMCEDRPMKHQVKRAVVSNEARASVNEGLVAGALAFQFSDEPVDYVCAPIQPAPFRPLKRLSGPPATAAQIVDGHSVFKTIVSKRRDLRVALIDKELDGGRTDRIGKRKIAVLAMPPKRPSPLRS